MKFIFFGTPDFAATILEKLIASGFAPQLVICNPDRPAGRKHILTPPPTKSLIMKHKTWNISILQPDKLDEHFKLQVSSFKPEFAVVAAYAKIIPQEIINLFPHGIIGVHPSLLPKYRGTSPIQAVILNGDSETGVTLYLLDEKVDHGPTLADRRSQIANSETYKTLLQKLAESGGDLLAETLPKFTRDEIKPVPQNEAAATYTKKILTEDGFIAEKYLDDAKSGRDPGKATTIDRKIRALNPEPGAWTVQGGKRVKLLEAEIINDRLALKKIQEEGKTPRAAN